MLAGSGARPRPVRLAYQPPVSSTFLSHQTSHQQPASITLLSEQTSTSHQPPANRTGYAFCPGKRSTIQTFQQEFKKCGMHSFFYAFLF
jgi:hypothetical protein